KMHTARELMMKCDMCYDRTSVGRQPMCTTVCPSRALHYGTWEEMQQLRPRSSPHNRFQCGGQTSETKVFMMLPSEHRAEYLDVAVELEHPAPSASEASASEAKASSAADVSLPVLDATDPMLAGLYQGGTGGGDGT